MIRVHTCALWVAFALTGAAWGQDTGSDPEPGDVEPAPTFARLSYVQGEVSLQPADGQAPEPAELNWPLATGDRVLTGNDARAELTLGIAAVRLDERTDLSVAHLDEGAALFEVNSGTVNVHVRDLQPEETVEILTPGSTVRLLREGQYRVDVTPDGAVTLAVRQGDAEIDAGDGPVRVRDGQQGWLARGAGLADVRRLGRPDAFDDWSVERERQLSGSESRRYVTREVVGYEDLDRYGTWRTEPGYGSVWVPGSLVSGWAPYRYGRWVWVSPWGWTWLDRSPWGFAPFHYGKWAYLRGGWCWVPGPRHRHHRPIYAPGHPLVRPGHRAWKTRDPHDYIPRGYNVRPGVRAGERARIGGRVAIPRDPARSPTPRLSTQRYDRDRASPQPRLERSPRRDAPRMRAPERPRQVDSPPPRREAQRQQQRRISVPQKTQRSTMSTTRSTRRPRLEPR